MARIFIDGFESGGSKLWDTSSVASVISSAGLNMNGDYCLDLSDAYAYLEKNVDAASGMYFSFLYRPINTVLSEEMLVLYSDTTPILHIVRTNDANGYVKVYRGVWGLLSTGTHNLTVDTTYHIEVYISIANSGGRAIVKIDSVTDIDFTGDTQESTYTQFNRVRLGYGPAAAYSTQAYFDNFIMDDANWIGKTEIQAKLLTGAGNSANWTPSAGANWACADERPPSDVDYNKTNSNDTTDTYATDSLTGTILAVKCVQVESYSRTEGAPTPTNLKLVVRRSGTDYLSADKSVPASYAALHHLWQTDPSTSAAWTEAGVNAAEIGIRSAA